MLRATGNTRLCGAASISLCDDATLRTSTKAGANKNILLNRFEGGHQQVINPIWSTTARHLSIRLVVCLELGSSRACMHAT